MKQRSMYWEQLIWLILVTRPFHSHLLDLIPFTTIITTLLLIKYATEGFTPITLFIIICLFIDFTAELYSLDFLLYLSAILTAILNFIPLKLYWLPQPNKIVGFRQDSLKNELHYFEFFPIDNQQPITLKSIKWNHSLEITKMVEYRNYSNKLVKKIAHMILSYADKHKLKIGEGSQLKTQKGIVMSHGKGGTPLFYSSLMMHFASLNYKVASVQHTEKNRINLNDKTAIKTYRQQQVKKRGSQLISCIQRLNTSTFVLMGHSYGCATVLQAYHSLTPQIKSKVTHIVLLDPWLFPLTSQIFNKKIDCPLAILANQDFVENEDAHLRNKQFVNLHKCQYIIWKDAHHMHQTDVGFINGNLLGVVKNSTLSKKMLELNIQAIDCFLKGQKIEGKYKDNDLGPEYDPTKYHQQKLQTW